MDDVRTSGFADPLRKQSFFFFGSKDFETSCQAPAELKLILCKLRPKVAGISRPH